MAFWALAGPWIALGHNPFENVLTFFTAKIVQRHLVTSVAEVPLAWEGAAML